MNSKTILKLGRVSNLPTVWTNAAAGMILAGALDTAIFITVSIILSLFYIGGMWLNDAFDAKIDAAERANRPIPQGEVSAKTVFVVGYVLLGLGAVTAFFQNTLTGFVAIGLGISVILYDWLHKRTILSPIIMGATRLFCYLLAAVTVVSTISNPVIFGALGLFAYIVGLTYAAKQEAYDRLDRAWPLGVLAIPVLYSLYVAFGDLPSLIIWSLFVVTIIFALRLLFRRSKGDVPKAVVTLIAGICLYDATLIASAGQISWAVLAVIAFALTLILQRVVSGI